MTRTIVLSGGGSQGAYQIGVWKALRNYILNMTLWKDISRSYNGAFMFKRLF